MPALAVIAVGLVFALLLADLAALVAGRARAQLAADAAALAAAPLTFFPEDFDGRADPVAAAAAAATANGAELISCDCSRNTTWSQRTVLVEVDMELHGVLLKLGHSRASAAATFDPTRLRR